jgi:hypothetical protein
VKFQVLLSEEGTGPGLAAEEVDLRLLHKSEKGEEHWEWVVRAGLEEAGAIEVELPGGGAEGDPLYGLREELPRQEEV